MQDRKLLTLITSMAVANRSVIENDAKIKEHTMVHIDENLRSNIRSTTVFSVSAVTGSGKEGQSTYSWAIGNKSSGMRALAPAITKRRRYR